MATSKRRQRQLARAKWERQQSRRAEQAVRRRRVTVVAGVVVGLVGTALLAWLVISIVNAEDARSPKPTAPVDTTARPSLLPEPTTRAPTRTQGTP